LFRKITTPALRTKCGLGISNHANITNRWVEALSQAKRWFKPCVKGNFSFLWESQKFDPYIIKTPDMIEIKFGTVDNVS